MGQVAGDFGEVAPEKGLALNPGFGEGEAVAFGDAGGGEGGGPGDEVGIGGVDAGLEFDGQVKVGGELLVVPVGFGVGGGGGSEGDLEGEALRPGGGPEEEFANIFSADGPGGVGDDGVGGGGDRGGGGEGGDRVGEKADVVSGDPGAGEHGGVAGGEGGVEHVGGAGVKPGPEEVGVLVREALKEEGVVAGPEVFGEVVELEKQGVALSGEPFDEGGESEVFPEAVVVDVPEVGRAAEAFYGAIEELPVKVFGVGGASIGEFGDAGGGRKGGGKVFGDAPGEDGDANGVVGKGERGGFDDAGDSAGEKVVVENGDPHPD